MTHYATLGVTESASADEIKKAYRKLASQHHPDKGGDTAKFQEIQTAYDVLSDAQKKQQYDLERSGRGNPFGGPGFKWHHSSDPDIEELFRNFGFSAGPFSHPKYQQPRRNKDLKIDIAIPMVLTLDENRKTVSVQTTNGHRETVEVVVPRGIKHGDQIKYPGLGDNLFDSLPRGDLYVHFIVRDAEGYIANGIDLHHKTSVNCLLAIVGGSIIITGLDGKQFELTIPPGTQPNTKFRISQQGLYQTNTNQRGDLYVEVAMSIPQNLSPEKLETIRSIL